jgi:hypothetical protein
VNRRDFLFATTAVVALIIGIEHRSNAFLLHAGGTSVTVPVQVATITYRNLLASNSPSPTPMRVPCWFARGQVPSGNIVVPYVGGSALATWQADNRVFWDDGSLMGAIFSVLAPSITASSTIQFEFYSQSGSWSNTSSVTLATAAGETQSNYSVALTNFHTAQIFSNNANGVYCQAGLTISGGAITGGVVQFNDNNTANGTYTVTQGHGSGASITITGTTISVVSGGSGYALEGVSNNGQFSAGFQAAYALYLANGNYTGGVRIEQYAKGPALDAWMAIMPLVDTGSTARPHTYAIFFIERWKTSSGTLNTYRAMAEVGFVTADDTNALYNSTFDLNWLIGASVIRGTTNGDAGYTTCMVNRTSSIRTYDSGITNAYATGRMDWASNDAVLKAIVQERTLTECAQLESTGLMLPYMTAYNGNTVGGALSNTGIGTNGYSVSTPPSTQSAYNPQPANGTGNEWTILPITQPMAMGGVRTYEGSGGGGHNEGFYPDNFILYWLALKGSYTTSAHSWLISARGAAGNFAGGTNSTPFLDTTGFRIANTVSAAAETFGTMPDLSAMLPDSGTLGSANGYCNNILHGGSGAPSIGASLSPYHLPRYAAPMFLIEGEHWMLMHMVFEAGNSLFYAANDAEGSARSCSLGGTAYWGLLCARQSGREFAWSLMTTTLATKLLSLTLADGSTNQEQAYLQYCLSNTFAFLMAFIPFTGTVTMAGNNAVTKSYDWTNSGVHDMSFFFNAGVRFNTLFSYYIAMSLAICPYIARDITNMKKYLNYFIQYWGGMLSFSGNIYMADSYTQEETIGDTAGGQPVTEWATIDPAETVQAADWPQAGRALQWITSTANSTSNTTSGFGAALDFTASSPTIAVVKADSGNPGTAAGLMLQYGGVGSPGFSGTGTVLQNGSALMMSLLDLSNNGASASQCSSSNITIPTPLAADTWYYMGNVSLSGGQQTFNLYDTQAHALAGGSTGMITPTQTMCNVQAWGAPYPSIPANNSGKGTYNGSQLNVGEPRIAMLRLFCALCMAYGFTASGDSVNYPSLDTAMGETNAITNGFSQCDLICGPTASGGVGVTFEDEPIYAVANTL